MIHVNITFTDQFRKLHIWDPQSVKVYRKSGNILQIDSENCISQSVKVIANLGVFINEKKYGTHIQY